MYTLHKIKEQMSKIKVKDSKMHRTQLFLPRVLQESLSQEAKSLDITNSELVRQIISQYLNKSNRQNTEAGMRLLLEMADFSDDLGQEKK